MQTGYEATSQLWLPKAWRSGKAPRSLDLCAGVVLVLGWRVPEKASHEWAGTEQISG